jgi:hypothetical protein
MNMPKQHKVSLTIEQQDALEFQADILILKFARSHYGLDLAISSKLTTQGIPHEAFMPDDGYTELIDSKGILGVKHILVVGVKSLWDFAYFEIRKFAQKALKDLHDRQVPAKHICLTLHGVGFGLDETEAFQSEIAGLVDAVTAGDIPDGLEKITIVDRNSRTVESLRKSLKSIIPSGIIQTNIKDYLNTLEDDETDAFRTVGYTSSSKPHVFVAMPFMDEMEDIYEYGIKDIVRDHGFVVERADLTSFTGDVMQWVKKRISSASLVIADLTHSNPNVYLEVGYAWGLGINTILLINDSTELQFDVRGQRCLVYTRIKHLEKLLTQELNTLDENNDLTRR